MLASARRAAQCVTGRNAPELVMFDMTGKEKERINLEKMSVTEIKMLLASHGFAERARKVEL